MGDSWTNTAKLNVTQTWINVAIWRFVYVWQQTIMFNGNTKTVHVGEPVTLNEYVNESNNALHWKNNEATFKLLNTTSHDYATLVNKRR